MGFSPLFRLQVKLGILQNPSGSKRGDGVCTRAGCVPLGSETGAGRERELREVLDRYSGSRVDKHEEAPAWLRPGGF